MEFDSGEYVVVVSREGRGERRGGGGVEKIPAFWQTIEMQRRFFFSLVSWFGADGCAAARARVKLSRGGKDY